MGCVQFFFYLFKRGVSAWEAGARLVSLAGIGGGGPVVRSPDEFPRGHPPARPPGIQGAGAAAMETARNGGRGAVPRTQRESSTLCTTRPPVLIRVIIREGEHRGQSQSYTTEGEEQGNPRGGASFSNYCFFRIKKGQKYYQVFTKKIKGCHDLEEHSCKCPAFVEKED